MLPKTFNNHFTSATVIDLDNLKSILLNEVYQSSLISDQVKADVPTGSVVGKSFQSRKIENRNIRISKSFPKLCPMNIT